MSKLEEMIWATEVKVDDERKPIRGYFPSPTAKYVAAAISRRSWRDGNREWSQTRLSEDTGLSPRTIWTALRDLEAAKILRREKVVTNNLRRADRLIFSLRSVRLTLEPEDQIGFSDDTFGLANIAETASQDLRGEPVAKSARQETGAGSKNKGDARERFVPGGWTPTGSHRVKALSLGFTDAEFDDLADGFRHHEFDKPKSDFDLAFHTWIRNAAKFKRERNDRHDRNVPAAPQRRPTQRDENLASVQRGFMAALDGRGLEGGGSPEDDFPI